MKGSRTTGGLFARLVAHLTAHFRFFGVYEYVVQSQAGEFIDLKPARKLRIGLPDEIRTPVRPGIPGAKGTPAIGSSVLVMFIDGDESRHHIVAFAGADGAGFVPTQVTIDASDRVIVAPSGKAELSSTAVASVLRTGELVTAHGAAASGDALAAAISSGSFVFTIALAPTNIVPGPPGSGFSQAFG